MRKSKEILWQCSKNSSARGLASTHRVHGSAANAFAASPSKAIISEMARSGSPPVSAARTLSRPRSCVGQGLAESEQRLAESGLRDVWHVITGGGVSDGVSDHPWRRAVKSSRSSHPGRRDALFFFVSRCTERKEQWDESRSDKIQECLATAERARERCALSCFAASASGALPSIE